jgi:hypothetical protein
VSVDHREDHALHFEDACAAIIGLASFLSTYTRKQCYNEDRYANTDCDRLELVKQNSVAAKELPDVNGRCWNSLTSSGNHVDDVGCWWEVKLTIVCSI